MLMIYNCSLKLCRVGKDSRICYSTYQQFCRLKERKLFFNVFPQEKKSDFNQFFSKSQKIYCGFDPTSKSLHLGHLLPLMVLLHAQRAGHQPIIVLGGATCLVGDPTGKKKERELMEGEEVEKNLQGLRNNIKNIFDNHLKNFTSDKNMKKSLLDPLILDNRTWYKGRDLLHFVSSTCRLFRLSDLTSRSSVQSRLASREGLSLSELMYQVLQAFDWWHLHNNHGCSIQVGGSDQFGNILSGFEFISKLTKSNIFGIMTPLVTTSSGEKLGKSAENAVWLDPSKTSPFHFYQYFLRLKDDDVEGFLKMLTFLPLSEIQSLLHQAKLEPSLRLGQKKLAEEVVTLVHGVDGLKSALSCTKALYSSSVEELSRLPQKDLLQVFEGASHSSVLLRPDLSLLDLLLEVKCFPTENDAIRVLKAGGVQVNHERVSDPRVLLTTQQFILPNNLSLIKIGKKNYHIVEWRNSLEGQFNF